VSNPVEDPDDVDAADDTAAMYGGYASDSDKFVDTATWSSDSDDGTGAI
jgi:hypothetical protein